MKTSRTKVTRILLDALVSELDDFIGDRGFLRRGDSLKYCRECAEGDQLVEMSFDMSPTYQPRALAHLLPRLIVSLSKVNEIVKQMVDGSPLLAGTTEFTFSEQIQNAAPREQRFTSWYIYDSESAGISVRYVKDFLKQWTLPFLDEYTRADAIARGFERHDDRLPADRRFLLFVVACYLLQGQIQRALAVLEDRFGRPGQRRRYAKVFDYVTARTRL